MLIATKKATYIATDKQFLFAQKERNNYMKFVIALLLCMFMLLGCAGQHCIKIGGNYDGIDGTIEYCYDAKESQKIGRPILKSETGQRLLSLSCNDAKKLNLLLPKKKKGNLKAKTSIRGEEFKRLLQNIK